MNTLTKLDTYVATYLHAPRKSPVGSPSKVPYFSPGITTTHRLYNLPPTPRKNRRYRRSKPTSSSVKLPPPTTPLLLRVVLGLWSILLSFWTSLVVETRAERVKRRRRGPTVLQQLTGDVGSEGEAEGEGSASEIEGGIASDDDWIDPVTRAPVDEKVDAPDDEEFAPVRRTTTTDEKFSFRLRSAEKKDLSLPPSPPETPIMPKTFIQQPTPPSILSNPLPSPPKRKVSNRLLPNPIATKVLDPTVPAVPASKTFTNPTLPSPRRNPTPFHLQKTLILDLDETLIHSTSRPISYAASAGGGLLGLSFGGLVGGRSRRREGHTVEVVLNGRSTTYHVYKRPHVDHFLKKVSHPVGHQTARGLFLTTGGIVVYPRHIYRFDAGIRRPSDRLVRCRKRVFRQEVISRIMLSSNKRILHQGFGIGRSGSE